MSASSPSPSFSPSLVPTPLATPQIPAPLAPQQSKSNNSADTPPPLSSTASSPPPQSPPPPTATSPSPPQSSPPVSASPPPSQSPPPAATSPPPPSLPTPPASPPSAPPPASPPLLPPPSPSVLSPPPPVPASPPVSASPPPPTSSVPTPPSANRPPSSSPSPPPPPAPRAISPSPSNTSPPAGAVPPPKSAKPPPPPAAKPPENPPPPPDPPSPVPSGSRSPPPPSPNSPPIQSPPPSRNQTQPVPTPTPTPTLAPPGNSSTIGNPPAPPLPSPITPGPGNATQITPAPSKPTNNTTDTVTVGNESSSNNNGIPTAAAIAIGTAAGFVVLCVVGLVLWFFSRRKKKVAGYGGGNHMLPTSVTSPYNSESLYPKDPSSAPLVGNVPGGNQIPYSPPDPDGLGHSRSWFTCDELSEATDGFSEHNLLGEGGFGSVYKGRLPDGREVAVKQLKVGGGQGEREFRAEVEIISRVHHRHLVSLVGYCISDHQRFLVYEYVPNNTLHYHLHGEGRPVLDWAIRRKVAAGAARGIAYLHEDCHPRIIHRDIKSSNILLDNNFDSKVSDFGLAKFALDSFTHVTTRVMGTFGYLAPEYASSGKLTEKSDVFSFGVVLLELITGCKPVDASRPLGDESLVEWARPLLCHALDNGGFEGLVDPRLGKNYVENEMLQMIEAAAACVRHSAAKRPRMSQVVRALDGISDSGDLSNGLTPGQSEFFVSAQSAEIRLFHRMAFGSQDFSTDVSQNSWRTEREL